MAIWKSLLQWKEKVMGTRSRHAVVWAVVVVWAMSPVASADVLPAIASVTHEYTPYESRWERWTLGWAFVPEQELMITALGFYDHDHDTLKQAHWVGLWDASGDLLSVLFAGGIGAPLVGDYRYSSIDPITVVPGQTYLIGTMLPGEPPVQCDVVGGCDSLFDDYPIGSGPGDELVFSPDLTLVDYRRFNPSLEGPFGPGPGLTYPGETLDGWCGAVNFLYEPVPELATSLLMCWAVGVVGLRRHRR